MSRTTSLHPIAVRRPATRPSPVSRTRWPAIRWGMVAVIASSLAAGSLVVHGAMTDPGGGPASAAGVGPAAVPRHVVAEPGDTLWAIADEHHGDVGFRRYLDALIDLNGGTVIQAGQVVRLP